jgi:hypothetical protein
MQNLITHAHTHQCKSKPLERCEANDLCVSYNFQLVFFGPGGLGGGVYFLFSIFFSCAGVCCGSGPVHNGNKLV